MLAIARRVLLGPALLMLPCVGVAGPPYLTDDPEPAETGHWETYHFVTVQGGVGEAGVDLNYGGAKNLQLTAIIPLQWEGGGTGLGEIELAVKYRVLHPAEGLPPPEVAFYPSVSLPTGPFSNGRASLFLPVWAQKDFGAWSVFGGDGYDWNSRGGKLLDGGIHHPAQSHRGHQGRGGALSAGSGAARRPGPRGDQPGAAVQGRQALVGDRVRRTPIPGRLGARRRLPGLEGRFLRLEAASRRWGGRRLPNPAT